MKWLVKKKKKKQTRRRLECKWSRIFSVGLAIVTESPELMFARHAINDSVGWCGEQCCSGSTSFWSRISINGAHPLKPSPHLAFLSRAWWKRMKKMFLDNLAGLSTVPYICQRACFDIKGGSSQLPRAHSDGRWRNEWAEIWSKSVILAFSCPSEVGSCRCGVQLVFKKINSK